MAQKVKSGREEISEIFKIIDQFHACCPICHRPDCAQFLGYYYRQVIDENGRYYPDFPVPRFICRGKEASVNVDHKTFSLLHYHLIPYSKYSLPFVIGALKARHNDKMTLEEVQEYLGNINSNKEDYKEVSVSGIFSFKKMLLAAINRIRVSDFYRKLPAKLWKEKTPTAIIQIFLDFCNDFVSQKFDPHIRGPCILAVDFYISGGYYHRNAYFLFGTPSQFRKARQG